MSISIFDIPSIPERKITADALKDILARHFKWICGEEGGAQANLAGAYLNGANLDGANLNGAYLAGAYLDDDTTLDTGETWKEYREIVVPALLAAGGREVEAGWVRKAWDCHNWDNCPMHAAFGISSVDEGPILLRHRIKQFVQLFDARLIPCPFPDEAPSASCVLPTT